MTNASEQTQNNADRIRRARSWCDRGMQIQNRDEETFLFLWIAFNAAYGKAGSVDRSEAKNFTEFVNLVVLKKRESRTSVFVQAIESFLFSDGNYPAQIKSLVENRYVFQPFWDARQDEEGDDAAWQDEFRSHKRQIKKDWENRETAKVLGNLLWRLYTLRNQLLHGNMTYGFSWGDQQIHDGALIMRALAPEIVEVLDVDIESSPDTTFWGQVNYPRHEVG